MVGRDLNRSRALQDRTVPDQQASSGTGHDVLIVCGFIYLDPHVSEEAKRYGMPTVLPTRTNPELIMDDELLKTTGAGNFYMVFGEPHVDVSTCDDGRLVASIRSPCLRPDQRHGPVGFTRGDRLLVQRHRLQRGGLLHPARLLHWHRRAVQASPTHVAGGDRRERLGESVPQREPTVPIPARSPRRSSTTTVTK
jgi:hypothetical protein